MLPSKITFYCRKKDEDGIQHTFPVDSEANHDTAKMWAEDSRWGKEKKEIAVYEFDNSNFDNVTIKDLSYRGNGGRAYQVIVERDGNKFKVDLREDTLMDVIRNTGIQAGGKLNGTFCFVKDGAQTNLIREGTARHERAKAEAEKKATYTKNIKKSELKPGYVYSTLTGDKKVFLGHVYSRSINKDSGIIEKPHKALLFVDRSDIPADSSLLKLLKTGEFTSDVYYWEIKVMKSHSLKIEGEKKIDVDLATFVKNINKFCQENFNQKMQAKFKGTYWLNEAISCYELAHMKVDKKDLDFSESGGKDIVRAYSSRNNYHW